MTDKNPRPRRENDRPLDDLLVLVHSVLGSLAPDRLVSWLGVSKRNAERWLDGSSTFPPRVISELERLQPLMKELDAELDAVVEDFKADGVPENLLRMHIREYSKKLSDAPPPKPEPVRE
ncbi:hypothetical protein GCM10011390_19320 [Aureimonas endophytica]|uniref:Uncharacterized protein n=1 Tax=Aureimonas endophytica TaxID=2027858 RepID=A0A916ZJ82_9HYPH|nr:hypothetical protein [Aureimonas endophytica]GGE00642.1 hypothetical protein GCM10011390_19320 [Aureimonas endophytica]